MTADELRAAIRAFLDADDATHFGPFERDLEDLLERHATPAPAPTPTRSCPACGGGCTRPECR